MTLRLAAMSLAASALSLAAPANAQPAPAAARLAQQGRWLVDPAGRVVIIHGGNVGLPAFREGAPSDPRWSPDTPARMAEQGFNGVRLVVFFSALMPAPGKIDTAYVDRIAHAVSAYAAVGIYTLIDVHQDEYSAAVGVRGMPEWAVFADGHQRRPGLEFPMGYFQDPAVQLAFDNFWANHSVPDTGKGVQDLYVEGLAAVARRFRDDPAVVGIDVMNEPATGTKCAQPDPAKANCPELEQTLLRPFYRKAAAAIGRAAPRLIVFVEPFMLQGALGIPIDTPIAGPQGRRGLSFHNYGPIKATRDKVNGGALALAEREGAAILNTEWGFSNNPAEVSGQAADFDARNISWLAWPRGAFEALVDPRLPDRGNGNRIAILRAYARPYAERTAGTPRAMTFDGVTGSMTYSYRADARVKADTVIRIPAIQYPQGYRVTVAGGTVRSTEGAPLLLVRARRGATLVTVRVDRIGTLSPIPAADPATDGSDAALRALPPIPDGPLTRDSLLGHIVATPGGRALLDRQVPGMLTGMSHVHGWEKLTLAGIRQFASSVLTDRKLAEIDAELAALKVTPGPVVVTTAGRLGIDSLTSDLLADPRAREVLRRHAPGLLTSSQQGLFPQTRLRNLQPAMPEILTDAVLAQIEAELAALP